MIIGENFKSILFEEVLTGIAKIMNSLNCDMLGYDDELFNETLSMFTDDMKKTVISYIDNQITVSQNIRNEIL